MTAIETSNRRTPWHEGERILQARHGVAERMESVGQRVIRDFMPEQHRQFFEQLPFVVIGSVDGAGRPWASLLEGPPGFARSPDPRLLSFDRRPPIGDPVNEGIFEGASVGLLGIELATRRRNRMNGRAVAVGDDGFAVAVEQSFGNCPQYIQLREPVRTDPPSPPSRAPLETLAHLDAEAVALIEGADTCFVASFADVSQDPARRAVDVSHRGGRPGFMRVEGDRLTLPDFAGNLHFNTLGNLLVNPRAGLLIADFASGDVLQLSGRTDILDDSPEVRSFEGAERLWRLHVESAVRRRGALDIRLALREPSHQSLATGTWDAWRTRPTDRGEAR
jgi:uncharacterized protein